MKKIFSIIAITSILFFGCDKVEVPQQTFTVVVPTSDTIRRILIEDFTGHTCQNCPAAARLIDSLESAFPGQIIGVGVHIDFFAEPIPPHGPVAGMLPGTFTEDFRVTAEDADYDAIFQSNSFPLPTGFVNRLPFPSSLPTAIDYWASAAVTILSDSMTAYIKINPSYNSSTRILNVNVTGEFMCDTTGTYNITLYLVEDDLQGSQVDATVAGGIDNNYIFKHVFRGCINSPGTIGGEQVASGTIVNGQLINYSMTNPFTVSNSFNAANCKIVAYLYNIADRGILQAAECDLQ